MLNPKFFQKFEILFKKKALKYNKIIHLKCSIFETPTLFQCINPSFMRPKTFIIKIIYIIAFGFNQKFYFNIIIFLLILLDTYSINILFIQISNNHETNLIKFRVYWITKYTTMLLYWWECLRCMLHWWRGTSAKPVWVFCPRYISIDKSKDSEMDGFIKSTWTPDENSESFGISEKIPWGKGIV